MIEIMNQKITNGDRIRSMTDEELESVVDCLEIHDLECEGKTCKECMLDWLRQEAK